MMTDDIRQQGQYPDLTHLIEHEATGTFNVTEEMQAAFDGTVIHPVLGTVYAVYFMEWTARQIILPHVSPDRESIGVGVTIRHQRPAPVGASVSARATCTSVSGNIVKCDVLLQMGDVIIATGSVWQAVLLRSTLAQRFESAMSIHPQL